MVDNSKNNSLCLLKGCGMWKSKSEKDIFSHIVSMS